jgi:hypothetical protein
MEHLQYPVGKHHFDAVTMKSRKEMCIETIAIYPQKLEPLVRHLRSTGRLQVPYREGGWTAQQVVHHIADSHMHALLRFKMTLTEDSPVIKPYDEGPTALLSDYATDVDFPLSIINGVHAKWSNLLCDMSEEDYDKYYVHPQYGKHFSLWEALSLYEWHSRHHLGHLQLCK